MEISDNTLLILAAILFFGLIVPHFFRRVKLPFASSLILLGAIMGPYGFNYVQPDETMSLFGFLGAAFYMMLAGFEAETLHLKNADKRFWMLFTVGSLIPFFTGTAIVKLFGYSWPTALFMGIVFISSSIMVAFSNVRYLKIGNTSLGKNIRALALMQDITSLLLIFIAFKYLEPHQRFPLPILLGLLISSVVILRMFLPEIVTYFFQRFEKRREGHEAKSRLVIALLLLVIVLYSTLDVHPIIAAFLVGFTLSEIPHAENIRRKLNTIGNALFIPIFLFVVGVDINLRILASLTTPNYLLISVVIAAFLSKYLGGSIGAKMAGFLPKQQALVGASSSVKLTVTLSAAYAALTLGLIDTKLYTAIALVSVLSIVINRPIMVFIHHRMKTKPEPTG